MTNEKYPRRKVTWNGNTHTWSKEWNRYKKVIKSRYPDFQEQEKARIAAQKSKKLTTESLSVLKKYTTRGQILKQVAKNELKKWPMYLGGALGAYYGTKYNLDGSGSALGGHLIGMAGGAAIKDQIDQWRGKRPHRDADMATGLKQMSSDFQKHQAHKAIVKSRKIYESFRVLKKTAKQIRRNKFALAGAAIGGMAGSLVGPEGAVGGTVAGGMLGKVFDTEKRNLKIRRRLKLF